MKSRIAFALPALFVVSLLGPASAIHLCHNVSESPGDSRHGEIAASDYGDHVVVAWQEGTSGIRARSRSGGTWGSTRDLGPGRNPTVACGYQDFTIAYELNG